MRMNRVGAILIALLARTACASDFHFGAAGNDVSGDGSLANPWRSIAKLNALDLEPGDNVLFHAGESFAGNIVLNANDSASSANGVFGGSPISFGSYGIGNRPIISSVTGHGLHATNAGGLEIRGLEFAGTSLIPSITSLANTTNGLFLENTQSFFQQQHVYIDDVVVHGFGQDGINFHATNPTINSGGFADVRIINSEVHTNGRSGIVSSVSSASGFVVNGSKYDFEAHAHANFYLANNVVHSTTGKAESSGVSGNGIVLAQVASALIERNVAHHNGGIAGGGGVGIWTWQANDVTIQFNEAYENDTSDGRDGGGFDLDGGATNSVMQYNYSHGNFGAGYGLFEFGYASAMGGNAIRYNVSEADGAGIAGWGSGPRFGDDPSMVDFAEDSIFHNNTIINPTRQAAIFFGSLEDLGVYNNIFVTSGGNKLVELQDWGPFYAHDLEFLGNTYWSNGSSFVVDWEGTTYTSLAAWANATGQEKVAGMLVGQQVDPLLAGPFNGGLTLDDPALLASLTAYRLLATSTLIDAGLDLASLPLAIVLGLIDPGPRDFFGGTISVGNSLDIGAHEAFAPGDFNGNGAVDASDYTIWRDTTGSIDDLRADGNGDRMIDQDDYDIWKSLFGTTYNNGLGSGRTVPESTSAMLLIFGSAMAAVTANRWPTIRVNLRGAKSCA